MNSTGPTTHDARRRRSGLAFVLVAAMLAPLALGVVVAPSAGAARVADPLVAPATTPSADGRSATDGVRTLAVSQAAGLNPSGQAIRVLGSGYETNKGVYVALCVIPPRNTAPSPCGGGADMDRSAGAAEWISNNPPPYAVGLTKPYGAGGSFDTTFLVSPMISPTIDCRTVRCAIVTRNDHTRGSDRSQDIFVPVSFAAPVAQAPTPTPAAPAPQQPGVDQTAPTAPQTTAPTTAPSTPAAPTTTIATTTTVPAPTATVAEDGLSVADGTRTLSASVTTDLDPQGETVELVAEGFDTTRGVFVSLCALDPESGAPVTCASGEDRSAWFTNTPPEWAEQSLVYEGDGFTAELELEAVIDSDTDCREVECVVAVRADDTEATDRSLDLFLPVSFAEESDGGDEDAVTVDDSEQQTIAAVEDADGDSGFPLAALVGLIVVLAALAGVGAYVIRRRRGPPSPPSDGAPGVQQGAVGGAG